MRTLQKLGWRWHDNGVVLTVTVDGHAVEWFVPADHVVLTFGSELASVGCPLPPSVGAYPSVSGLFGGLKRAFRKASRAVKRAVPKAVSRAAKKVARVAKASARKYGLPALAPIKLGDDLRRRAFQAAGLGKLYAAGRRNLPGPFGSALTLQDTLHRAATNVAKGRNVNWGRTLADAGGAAASFYGGRAGGAAAKAAARAAQAIARGKRVDRALKNQLLREAPRALGRVVPGAGALNQAGQAWRTAQKARSAAMRLRQGINVPGDAARLQQGRQQLQALRDVWRRARVGDPAACEFCTAFRSVGGYL